MIGSLHLRRPGSSIQLRLLLLLLLLRWWLRSPRGIVAVPRHGRRSPLVRAEEEWCRRRSRRRFPFYSPSSSAHATTHIGHSATHATAAADDTTAAAANARWRVPQLLRGGADAENARSDGGATRVTSNGSP